MSYKIPFHFISEDSEDGIPSTRLLAWVKVKSGDGYLMPLRAIVDIGSPVSIVPFRIWGQSLVTMGKRTTIQTIAGREECEIGVTHGEITFTLMDEDGNELYQDLTIPADLCDTSEMPFLLGMHKFLKMGCFMMNYPTGESWLELPDNLST